MQLLQRRQKRLLRIQHGDIGPVRTRHLAVQVKHKIMLFHCAENGVKSLVVDDASSRVCRHAGRVRLYARDAGLLGLCDCRGRDGRVQVERHEEGDVGCEGLQARAVGRHGGDGRERRDKVGHDEDGGVAA